MSPPIEDRDLGFAEMVAELKKLGGKQITIGVHGDEGSELVKIATIHEFGTRAWRPSWKQAYYLAVQIVRTSHQDENGEWTERRTASGRRAHLHRDLNADEKAIAFAIARKLRSRTLQIPERSFLRAPFDATWDKIQTAADRAVGQVVDGKVDANEALQQAFSGPFVTGNVIALAVNGAQIPPVAFIADSPTTLLTLAQVIAAMPGADSAQLIEGGVIAVQNRRMPLDRAAIGQAVRQC